MTDAQKLQALITRAIEGGFDLGKCGREMNFEHFLKGSDRDIYFSPVIAMKGYSYGVIFNHQFAKALFGEERMPWVASDLRQHPPLEWHYHLQQMVIADNPIDYMYGVVFNKP